MTLDVPWGTGSRSKRNVSMTGQTVLSDIIRLAADLENGWLEHFIVIFHRMPAHAASHALNVLDFGYA